MLNNGQNWEVQIPDSLPGTVLGWHVEIVCCLLYCGKASREFSVNESDN